MTFRILVIFQVRNKIFEWNLVYDNSVVKNGILWSSESV